MSPSNSLRFVILVHAAILAASVSLGGSDAMAAALVNIDTGKSLSLLGGESGSIALSFTNDGSEPSLMTSYTLALMFVPTSRAGTLAFDLWTGPASNPLLSDLNAEYTPLSAPTPLQLLAPVVVSGTDYFDYFKVEGTNTNGFNDPLGVGVTKNVGVVNLSAGVEPGTWDIYVVNQKPEVGGLPVSFLQLSNLDVFGFGNLAVADGANLLIGSVTVTAVPEPSSIAAGICGGVALAVRLFRRRRTGVRTTNK